MPIVSVPTYLEPVSGKEVPIGIEARGSIAKTRTYQMSTVFINGNGEQRRRVQLQYPYHVPYDRNSEGQAANRLKFKNGVAAWKALSPEDKTAWNALAALEYENRGDNPGSYLYHNGFMLHQSHYMLTN